MVWLVAVPRLSQCIHELSSAVVAFWHVLSESTLWAQFFFLKYLTFEFFPTWWAPSRDIFGIGGRCWLDLSSANRCHSAEGPICPVAVWSCLQQLVLLNPGEQCSKSLNHSISFHCTCWFISLWILSWSTLIPDILGSWNRGTPSHHPFRTMGFSIL